MSSSDESSEFETPIIKKQVKVKSESESETDSESETESESEEEQSRVSKRIVVKTMKKKSEEDYDNTCNVCCEKLNLSIRRPINCPSCQYIACKKCSSTYILSTFGEPSCMNCHKTFTKKFIFDNFTFKFLNGELKEKFKRFLLEEQKVLIQETLTLLLEFKEIKSFDRQMTEIRRIKIKLKKETRVLEEAFHDYDFAILRTSSTHPDSLRYKIEVISELFRNNQEINLLNHEIKILNLQKKFNDSILEQKRTFLQTGVESVVATKPISFREFLMNRENPRGENPEIDDLDLEQFKEETIKPEAPVTKVFITNINCPEIDCKGLLNNKHFCKVCGAIVCAKCMNIRKFYNSDEDEEPNDDGIIKFYTKPMNPNPHNREMPEKHVCNEDDVKSVKLRKSDTKPCPKCSIPIHKIAGCNMMWCVACKTPFNWANGEIIIKGHIHNPHYAAYMQNQNQNNNILVNTNQDGCPQTITQYVCYAITKRIDVDISYLSYYLTSNNTFMHSVNNDIIPIDYNDPTHCVKIFQLLPQSYGHNIGFLNDSFRIPNQVLLNKKIEQERVKFILNQISEKKFASWLYSRHKLNDKIMDIRMLMEILQEGIQNTLQIMYNYGNADKKLIPANKFMECMKELINLREYVISQLKFLAEIYNNKMPVLGMNFSFYRDTSKKNKTIKKQLSEESISSVED